MKGLKEILNNWWDEVSKLGSITDLHMAKLFIELKKREERLTDIISKESK